MVNKFVLVLGLLFGLVAHADKVHIVSPQAGIDITTAKVSHISGEVDRPSEFQFEEEMALTLAIPGPRVIIINSPGGRVDIGEEMIQTMLLEKKLGTKMICVATIGAHSMAFNFLTFCDVRLATADTHFIVHKIALSGIPDFERITGKLLRELADMIDKMDERYRQANAKAMHMSIDEYDHFADEQHCWSAPMLYFTGYLQGIATIGGDSTPAPPSK